MNIIFSFFVSVCLMLSSLFYGAPIAPPEVNEAHRENEPESDCYVYDRIEGANGACFYIGRPDEAKLNTVLASDFGMDEAKADNTAELNSALAYCAAHPGTRLVIPKGTYRFTSNDTIRVFGCENLLVEGNGARFIFTSTAAANKFTFRSSSFVEFRNLDTDWDWENDPVGRLVKIVGENDKAHTMDLEFTEYDSVSENMVIKAMTICDPETYTMGAQGEFKESYFYQQPDGIRKIEKIAPNVLRVTHNGSADYFEKGQYYMLRHHVYDATVFRLEGESNNLTFDGINIFASAGMAFTAGESCSRFHIKNTYIGVEKSRSDKRHIALGADAIHIADTKGYFCIEGCDISAMGDDAINVHDNLAYVTQVINDNTIKALVKFRADVGTEVAFKNSEFYDIDLKGTVTHIAPENGEYVITFDTPVGREADKGYIFYDANCNSGNYVIRNNCFHENRARGLLLQSSNGLCENNRFYKTMGQAIKVVMDIQTGLWFEGTGVDNLVIRNNEFEQCNFSAWGEVIHLGTNFDGKELKAQPFTNIVINGNKFINCPDAAVTVRSANGIEISDNSVWVSSLLNDNGKIVIKDSASNIITGNNTLTHCNVSRGNCPKCQGFKVWTDVLANKYGSIKC